MPQDVRAGAACVGGLVAERIPQRWRQTTAIARAGCREQGVSVLLCGFSTGCPQGQRLPVVPHSPLPQPPSGCLPAVAVRACASSNTMF